VYNWDITLLVGALAREVINGNLSAEIEIVIADDCSKQEYKEKNKKALSTYSFCRYFEQEERLGRSGIRNFLIKETKHPHVLMLDADMLPDTDNFLAEYLQQITSDLKVICGGYSYKTRIMQGREYDFYVYKGKKTEEIPARERNKTPWRYLFTGNVLVPRQVLDAIAFDEEFVGYGYEDIEWGIRLFSLYPIHHIDNTCSHLGLVQKDTAFIRMRSSISNFLRMETLHPELFSRTGAARMSRVFFIFPEPLLKGLDKMLSSLFHVLHINSLCFILFQLDKAVLLALSPGNNIGSKDS
jgi:glycosyltransferase involved in cell wall biosynthesis